LLPSGERVGGDVLDGGVCVAICRAGLHIKDDSSGVLELIETVALTNGAFVSSAV
jgi:hypothetical protein